MMKLALGNISDTSRLIDVEEPALTAIMVISMTYYLFLCREVLMPGVPKPSFDTSLPLVTVPNPLSAARRRIDIRSCSCRGHACSITHQ